jgi:hypothetical protein
MALPNQSEPAPCTIHFDSRQALVVCLGRATSSGATNRPLWPLPTTASSPSTRPLTSFADLTDRAAIGPIPGGLVIVAGVVFHGWAAFALVTLRTEIIARRERGSLIAIG